MAPAPVKVLDVADKLWRSLSEGGSRAPPPPSPLAITSVGIEAGPWALPGPWEGEGAGAVWPRGVAGLLGTCGSWGDSPPGLPPLLTSGPSRWLALHSTPPPPRFLS